MKEGKKEYKVLKIRKTIFRSDLDKKIQEALNEHAKMGWELEGMMMEDPFFWPVAYLVLARKTAKH